MPSENDLDSAEFEPKRPTANNCLTEQQIDDYLQGRLHEGEMEVLEAHISLCPVCLARFEEEEGFQETMARAARLVETERAQTNTPAQVRTSAPPWRTAFSDIHKNWGYAVAASVVAIGLLVISPGLRETRSPQSVTLDVMRGADNRSLAAPDRPLVLRANLSGLDVSAGAQFLLVDSSGTVIATQPIASGERESVWRLSAGLPSGAYWVRIVSPTEKANVLREFALEIR